MSHDSITLSRLRLFGHHGVFEDERRFGQRFEVTVKLVPPLPGAGQNDDLAQTVDYRHAFETVRAVLEGNPCNLVECMTETMTAALLERFPSVEAVEVELCKPQPPVPFAFDGFSIKIYRKRILPPTLNHSTPYATETSAP